MVDSRRRVLFAYVVGCVVAASLAVISPAVDEASAYTPHAIIAISGDSGFTAANGVVGGSGAEGDPYVISGWDIDAGWSKAIEILDTNAHFVISDCYLHGSSWYVVYLSNAHNGTFRNNNVTSNYIGVTATSCERLVVANNTISDTVYYGLNLMLCNGTLVLNNSIGGSRFFGMVVNDCIGAVLRDNAFVDDGIEMWGNVPEEYNTHQIDTSNSVNGLPILYYSNEADVVVDSVPVGQLIFANCSGIQAAGLDISGPEVAVISAFCSNETISDSSFANAPYCLWFSEVSNLWIHNNSISDACNDHMYIVDPGMAIYAYMCDGVFIENNVVNNSDFGAFLGRVSDVLFRYNTVSFGNYASAFGAYSAVNVLVEFNELHSKDGAVGLSDSVNCSVANNSMADNVNDAFLAMNVTGLTFTGNVLVNNGFGVRLQEVRDVSMSFNSVTGAGMYTNFGRYGIDVSTGSNVTLSNNTVAGIPDGGIRANDVSGVTLSGNSISSNLNDGLALLSCSDISVLDNWIDSNGDDGLLEYGGSGSLEIIGNQIQNNVDSGIETSIAAEISRNTVAYNGWYGIGLAGTGSTVYHNNIIGNLIQAFQNDGYPNAWDNGYPDGGNYWSDYGGADMMNGPAQDLPGSDGIGDTPRTVQVGNQDRYPLMLPFDWNRPPVASFEATPSQGDVSTVFEFDASASWDYETQTDELLFRWDWNDDGVWDTGWSDNSTASHQFDMPGTYSVRLQVRDANGTEGEYALTVEVVDVIPEIPVSYIPIITAALCLLVLAIAGGRRRGRRTGPT